MRVRALSALSSRGVAAGLITGVALAGVACTAAPPTVAPISGFTWPAGSGVTFTDAQAAGSSARLTWSNATGTGTITAPALEAGLQVRARGDQCDGAPLLTVSVDGVSVGTASVSATSWTTYTFARSFAAGQHTVALGFPNDYSTSSCDRNLRLDTAQFTTTVPAPAPAPAPVPVPTGNPLAGAPFYVNPQSNAASTAASLRTNDPGGAALFDKIAGQQEAEWFGDWVPTSSIGSTVAARTSAAGSSLPLYVIYAIPQRDCGGYSSGGLSGPADYHTWVSNFAAGLGTHRATVILEPDALPQLDCLSATNQATRLSMLRDAVTVLGTHPAATVYLDAGNSGWQPAQTMADRLRSAGVAATRGFSLNVSNFDPTSSEQAYGDSISSALSGAHFVVDTSRNGLGPATTWCNPSGEALGTRPTTASGDTHADALLWIKDPGDSDGTCNGGPAAGTWWPDYARGLASRAAW